MLKSYYRVTTNKQLYQSLLEDLLVSIFLFAGTGLATSIVKGVLGLIFIKGKFPILIGKRVRLKHPSNIKLGHHVWIKDDVSLLADAPMTIGDNVIVAEKSTLTACGEGLKIGDDVVIGKNCYIAQNGGPITIGNNVLISDYVRIYTLNHKFSNTQIPIKNQGCEYTEVHIKDNVWIGSGAVIFNNVTIGSGAVIGANTVVREDVPDRVVFAGNPGKIIKKLR